ncbi:MAG TPA: hypothetical protein PLN12_16360 [Flavobacteriales bacterium]|nr:hypothetical protein [Flavobacteriales bacterium]
MSRSSEWALRVQAEEVQRQELAEREQDYFNTFYSKDRLGSVDEKHELRKAKQPGETAHKNSSK